MSDGSYDQKRTLVFFCYGYGADHYHHIMSIVRNGGSVNISTKDIVQIYRCEYFNGSVTKESGIDIMSNISDTFQYQLNKIIAEKSMNVYINQNVRPSILRGIHSMPCKLELNEYSLRHCSSINTAVNYQVRQTSEYHQLMYKTFFDQGSGYYVPLPPPGFSYPPRRALSLTNLQNLTDRLEHMLPNIRKDDDLDVNEIIEEFRAQAKIHVDYEKRIITTRFFIMNLNSKIMKFIKANTNILGYKNIVNISFEKLLITPFNLLKRLGFDVILVDDEEVTIAGRERTSLSTKIANNLAMEFVNNDFFANDVINACNSHLNDKERMPYTKMFDSDS